MSELPISISLVVQNRVVLLHIDKSPLRVVTAKETLINPA